MKTANGQGATCVACDRPASLKYIKDQSIAGLMSAQMVAVVTQGDRRKVFLSPTEEHMRASASAVPNWKPSQKMADTPTLVSGRGYGITSWHQLFSERQLTALTTFADLLKEIRAEILRDDADEEYANTILTYLALVLNKAVVAWSQFGVWHKGYEKIEKVFGRQAIPMVWDYPEANPFSDRMQSWMAQVEHVSKVVEKLPVNANPGFAHQSDAATTIHASNGPIIVTDPPYYNSIDYADLSDYMYVWLRHALRDIYPDLFDGILTPKDQEMTAIPSRFDNPTERFESLLSQALQLIKDNCSQDFPSSIFYAYKQQEEERAGRASTGWEAMLSALVSSGFQIVGTWPIRTEQTDALKANSNVLASSVILVCRPRPEDAPTSSRGDFLEALAREIPAALEHLTREGHIAPADLRQAAIGPGMAVYSQYGRVETLGGEPISIRQALMAINEAVANYLQQQAGQLDAESQFCLNWLQSNPNGEGEFGTANDLARVYDLSIGDGLERRHRLLSSGRGRVRLLGIDEYSDQREYLRSGTEITAWEGCLRMAWHMQPGESGDGTPGCSLVAQRAGNRVESIERLARILYDVYDQRNDSRSAVMFNNVVMAWPEILRQAAETPKPLLERLI